MKEYVTYNKCTKQVDLSSKGVRVIKISTSMMKSTVSIHTKDLHLVTHLSRTDKSSRHFILTIIAPLYMNTFTIKQYLLLDTKSKRRH